MALVVAAEGAGDCIHTRDDLVVEYNWVCHLSKHSLLLGAILETTRPNNQYMTYRINRL